MGSDRLGRNATESPSSRKGAGAGGVDGRLHLVGGVHLYGSACFFVFALIYWFVVGSGYMFASNSFFGVLCALNWFVFRRRIAARASATTFLAVVYLGLMNVVVHLGVYSSPLAYWGLSVAVAAAFTHSARGIVAWTALCLVFFPLSLHLKRTWFASRAIPLDAAQTNWLDHASYFGILLFLGYASYLFRTRLTRLVGALEQSEAKYRNRFHAESDAIVVFDPSSLELRDVNPAFCALYGYTADEAARLTMKDICADAPATPGAAAHQRHVRRDGTTFEADVSSSQFVQDDRPFGVSTVRDVSDRRRAEEERERLLQAERAAREEANRASLAKDVFLATLSHELRTPLTAILTWSQLLRSGRVNEATARHGLGMIEASARAQGRLIDDLLDVSRAVAGKLHLELQQIDPVATIRDAIDSVAGAAAEREIRVEATLDESLVSMHGDAVRLRQIAWNLLSNAIKFSEPKGTVEIRLERADAGLVRLVVADSGRGIPAPSLERIFEPFWQVDGTTTRAHGGMGLGLAIVRTLAELHGGTVRAESAGEGRGAVFTVLLPLGAPPAEAESASPSSSAEAADPGLHGLRVIVVDDEEASRDALAQLLGAFGAQVRCVSSAAAALDALVEWPPHVLVSDIAMPGEDGYSLIRKVRTQLPPPLGQLPAIAVTAHAAPEDARRALGAGFQSHLVKPVETRALVAAIAASVAREDRT